MGRKKPSAPRNLSEFFSRRGAPTMDAIARQLEVSAAYISLIAAGKRQPSLGLALRIEELTGVPAAALVAQERAAS